VRGVDGEGDVVRKVFGVGKYGFLGVYLGMESLSIVGLLLRFACEQMLIFKIVTCYGCLSRPGIRVGLSGGRE
jgi:hypothetical protein